MKNKHKFIITLNAPVVLVFVFICFIVTLIGVLTKGKSTELLFMTYHFFLGSWNLVLRY
ncbi:MAG: hypothetical protein IJL09_10450 [Lachnospiraceae bacterium]|nr:hypothetical protein [Lachnospiraceae bacterium]